MIKTWVKILEIQVACIYKTMVNKHTVQCDARCSLTVWVTSNEEQHWTQRSLPRIKDTGGLKRQTRVNHTTCLF